MTVPNDPKLVAYNFCRIFQYNEKALLPKSLDMNVMTTYDKVNGIMVLLFRHHDSWRVSSRYSPDAGDLIGDSLRVR